MDLVANNAAAFVSDTDPATRAVADEAAAIARAAQKDAGDDVSAREWPLQRLLALRAFEARAWRRRQARIGALDDDAYERGRAFQAYEDLLAELA